MNKKIIGYSLAGIILVGIIITFIFGLNVDMLYREHKQLEIRIGQEFNNNDIKNIVNEVVKDNRVVIKKVELFEDMVSIELNDITDEELNTLNTKVNEKYALNNSVDDIIITNVPSESLKDIVKPYILPVIISFVILEIYLAIYVLIYNKTNKDEKQVNVLIAMLEFACGTILVQLLYFSVLAIFRLPINRVTIPVGIVLFIATSILKFINKK